MELWDDGADFATTRKPAGLSKGTELWRHSLLNSWLQCNTKISLWTLQLSSSIAEVGEKENMGSICRQLIHNSSKKCVCIAFKPERNGILVKEQKLLTLNLSTKEVLFLPVFSSPSFNKAHSYGTHSSKLINCFKALIHRLSQKSSKFLVIKDF